MAKLQAKTEEQRERIKDLFSEGLLDSFYFDIDKEWVEIPCSYDKDVSNYITFDTMAKIVDYLREINNVDTTIKVQWDAMGIGQVKKYERE